MAKAGPSEMPEQFVKLRKDPLMKCLTSPLCKNLLTNATIIGVCLHTSEDIACGNSIETFSMAVRFLTGPAVIAAASIAIGLRGVLLHVAIAALPQAIVPFVFAKEYNVHPDILSTGVVFGILVALPITLVYYILLGL